MGSWNKLGQVFCPNDQSEWMKTHAANPVAEHIAGDLFRIYFSSRDSKNRSSIGFVELDLTSPHRILRISDEPVLSPGEVGLFDDSGVSMGWLTQVGPKRHLYYLGWNLGVTVPWRNSIGLAIAEPGQPFKKASLAPIMDRDAVDPYSISYPCVVHDGAKFRMWYGSNLQWGAEQKDMAHLLKYAESDDGIHWRRDGRVSIDFNSPDQYAISKPSVLKEDGLFRMWYSFRGAGYRIGYAESQDGVTFTRLDHLAGISTSHEGWDNETVEYPHVFVHRGKRYMLYNGNRYGLTGFGLAVWAD